MGLRSKGPHGPRIVRANQPKSHSYSNNRVTTSKYTWWNFIFKNLFEQFMRVANFYFLWIAVFQLLPFVPSPITPITSIAPLVFVLTVTAVKEIYEDVLRHRFDRMTNNKTTLVLRGGVWTSTKWKKVKVGEIVKLESMDAVPADLCVLHGTGPSGTLYVETSSLDGETNLKQKQAHEATQHLDSTEKLWEWRGVMHSEQPNNSIDTFEGKLMFDGREISIGPKQMALRGCTIRNTQSVYGLVVFTGRETKVMRNFSRTTVKRSHIEKLMNGQVLAVFGVLAGVVAVSAIFSAFWLNAVRETHWYLGHPDEDPMVHLLVHLFTFVILYNVMVPISLYVSVEVVKVYQALAIRWDLAMYDEISDTPANARTSSLNEELGQVSYVFSDKTGTLTQNRMEFVKCSVKGMIYGYGTTEIGRAAAAREGRVIEGPSTGWFDDPRLLQHMSSSPDDEIRLFLTCLAVCHEVIAEVTPGTAEGVVYQAASPDDGALVLASKKLGFSFEDRTPSTVTCTMEGKKVVLDLLNTLEFNSDRKRMSVIVRLTDGRVRLFCKGADTVIMERSMSGQRNTKTINAHLSSLSSEGLRTLVLAYRDLQEHEYEEWNKLYQEATLSIDDRQEKLDAVANIIEKQLVVLGVTAIEDKLQVGVPDTIATLADAGMKLWVLTGDKTETAINIGYACALLDDDMIRFVVDAETLEGTKRQIQKGIESFLAIDEDGEPIDDGKRKALVITGRAVGYCLEKDAPEYSRELSRQLFELADICDSVICCRVTPLQKKLVVDLVKSNVKAITLAIGDGANDVSMIKSAHIGVGISGMEGLQAVRASDFSIAQFRFLRRLLLVHGRYNYQRISKLVLYSFYKNMAFSTVPFWFCFISGFSAQTLYAGLFITSWNMIFTAAPVVMMAAYDKDVEPVTVEEDSPSLYAVGQENKLFNTKIFWLWQAEGLFHSAVAFWGPVILLEATDDQASHFDLWMMGSTSYTIIFLACTLKVALETKSWTWIHKLSFVGSIIVFFLALVAYSFIGLDTTQIGVMQRCIVSKNYWMVVVLCVVLTAVPNVAIKMVIRIFFYSDVHIYEEIERNERKLRLNSDTVMEVSEYSMEKEKQVEADKLTPVVVEDVTHEEVVVNEVEEVKIEKAEKQSSELPHQVDEQKLVVNVKKEADLVISDVEDDENDISSSVSAHEPVIPPKKERKKSRSAPQKQQNHAKLVHLNSLSFTNKVSDSNALEILMGKGNRQHVRHLDVSELQVDDHDIDQIVRACPQLESLCLKWCTKITDAAIRSIADNCKGLHSIDISGCKAVSEGCLISLWKQTPNMEHVIMRWCTQVGDPCLHGLAAVAKQLKHLDVQGCHKITDSGLNSICRYCPLVKTLDCRACKQLTDASLIDISKHCRHLAFASFRWCPSVTDIGVNAMMEGVADLNALVLDLRGTTLSDTVKTSLQNYEVISTVYL